MDTNNKNEVIKDRIKEYQANLKEWEAKFDQMDASARIEYEKERDSFTRELAEAWQDFTEAKLDEYMARIEGTYQNLKARWDGYFNDNDNTLNS